jgi:aspartyl/asparaginyl-tRNA synthetase
VDEMSGVGERLTTATHVEEALLQYQEPLETYQWYMDIRNSREVPSVGWGMGMERFMLWLLEHNDVRDIAVIPRLKNGKYLP